MTNPTTLDHLERLAREATPGPWLYRPRPHDDWGWVRSANDDLVARGYIGPGPYLDEYAEAEHRRNGTDPRGPNAQYIAAANPAAILELLAQHRRAMAVVEAARQAIVDDRFVDAAGVERGGVMFRGGRSVPVADALAAFDAENGGG